MTFCPKQVRKSKGCHSKELQTNPDHFNQPAIIELNALRLRTSLN